MNDQPTAVFFALLALMVLVCMGVYVGLVFLGNALDGDTGVLVAVWVSVVLAVGFCRWCWLRFMAALGM